MTGDEPAGGSEAALVEFQTTMQRFLETQERIMLAYLGGGEPATRVARPVLQPARPAMAAPAPRAAGVPAQSEHGQTNGAAGAAIARLAAAAKAPTTPPVAVQARPAAPATNGTAAPRLNGG